MRLEVWCFLCPTSCEWFKCSSSYGGDVVGVFQMLGHLLANQPFLFPRRLSSDLNKGVKKHCQIVYFTKIITSLVVTATFLLLLSNYQHLFLCSAVRARYKIC